MKFFKKVGKAIKKAAKSKVGKIVGIAAGVGLTALGVGAAAKGIKAAKALKVAKGLGSKKAGKGFLGLKGLFSGKGKAGEQNETAAMGGAIGRLSKRLRKKADRKQSRLDKRSASLAAEQSQLDSALAMARNELGSGNYPESLKTEFNNAANAWENSGLGYGAGSGSSMDVEEYSNPNNDEIQARFASDEDEPNKKDDERKNLIMWVVGGIGLTVISVLVFFGKKIFRR